MKTRPQPREYWKCWIDDGAEDYTVILQKLNKGWKLGKKYISPAKVEPLCRYVKDTTQLDLIETNEGAEETPDESEMESVNDV
jgi:hypothetical protein